MNKILNLSKMGFIILYHVKCKCKKIYKQSGLARKILEYLNTWSSHAKRATCVAMLCGSWALQVLKSPGRSPFSYYLLSYWV